MRRILVIFFVLAIHLVFGNTAAVIENVNISQRTDGSGLVDIYYDVFDADGDTLTVTMQASDDNGVSWDLSCQMVSGDIGDNILSGTGKHILWDFGAEHPGSFSENYKVRLHIDDHYIQQDDDWCTVPAGTYTWGQNDEIQTIDYDYEIMKYEVTNAQYVEYLEEALDAGEVWIEDGDVYGHYDGDDNYNEGDYAFYDLGTPSNYNYGCISYDGSSFVINVPAGYSAGDFDDHPVVEVSWFGSNAYALHFGWRLPTEEEWEKAARGMTGYDYPWGDVLSGDRANYRNSGDPWDNGTTPAGFYNGENGTTDSPSPYDCYDMSGNVLEWTDSWYNLHCIIPRGGSWGCYYTSGFFQTWIVIGGVNASSTDDDVGFRCSRTVD